MKIVDYLNKKHAQGFKYKDFEKVEVYLVKDKGHIKESLSSISPLKVSIKFLENDSRAFFSFKNKLQSMANIPLDFTLKDLLHIGFLEVNNEKTTLLNIWGTSEDVRYLEKSFVEIFESYDEAVTWLENSMKN